MGRHRPWLAAVLAVLVAGLGHAYLRRWRRAALWFVAILGTGVALLATLADPATVGPGDFPPAVVGPLLVLYGVSAIDAYRLARATPRARPERSAVGRDDDRDSRNACPNCGKSTDPDLDFCTWCTEPLDSAETTEE